ncbi:hypothetical protein OQX61_14830 [Pedobacter sp. PLR]|uniref:hypothetical protein n=1 Tax=Pedobacter sp. PLR TaxID=2994465 RepID=UPI002245B690|nr:hypothetical protein [Pedobacter sp. PLR]MCX2452549.1 hypothetical protein [Pedobacter sp. PLR]
MSEKQFQILAEQITESPWLGESQQEEKIIQLADLCRFISSYKPTISIEDAFSHKINVIVEEGVRKGVFFIDSKAVLQSSFDFSLFNSSALAAFKAKTCTRELWIVFVKDPLCSGVNSFTSFIEKRNIASFYDKIFCFDFFESKIQTLK